KERVDVEVRRAPLVIEEAVERLPILLRRLARDRLRRREAARVLEPERRGGTEAVIPLLLPVGRKEAALRPPGRGGRAPHVVGADAPLHLRADGQRMGGGLRGRLAALRDGGLRRGVVVAAAARARAPGAALGGGRLRRRALPA